ncbi:MAG: phosphate acetyltransferase [Spirochaetes bacterium]|nr:phosphate acetyltransferase [Spirochaetota bacterium]
MEFLELIRDKIKKNPKRLVLPESYDDRMIKAATILIKEGYCKELIMIGDENYIYNKAKELKVNIDGIKIFNINNFREIDKFAEIYLNKRKGKEVNTIEEARNIILSDDKFLYFGALLVEAGYADAMVAGAYNTTGDVLRASLRVIGVKKGFNVASSCFIMILPDKKYGENGIMLFADCATVPDPTSEQLAEIAVTTANTAKELIGLKPKVALLSYSTKGSATGPLVEKVQNAVKIMEKYNLDFEFDGEMQLDAAIIENVGKKKAPNSKVAGKANVLIFPDLNAGNIGYKLVERLGNAIAIGPILQGFNKPVNDLSRGCSVEDIVNVSIITMLKA